MKFFVCFLFVGNLFANDTTSMGTASNVRFIKNNNIVIHQEDLTVGPMDFKTMTIPVLVPVLVDYQMENLSDKADAVQVAFPLPGCTLDRFISAKIQERSSNAETCIKRPEMKLTVDGKIITGEWITRYLVDGTLLDESIFSKKTGVTSEILNSTLGAMLNLNEFNAEKLENDFQQKIKNICKKFGDKEKNFKCDAMKKVWAENVYLWKYDFPPKKIVKIKHEYKVEASYNRNIKTEFKTDVFCVKEPSIRNAWKKQEATQDPFVHHFFIQYILKTGGNWAKPIETFNLKIIKQDKDQFISTCFSGLNKSGALEFTAQRKNFIPEEDLYVLFFYTKPFGRWEGTDWIPFESK